MTIKCRICLEDIINLECVSIQKKLNEETSILEGIVQVSSVEVLENDSLPQFICNVCYLKLDNLYTFRTLIISTDRFLKEKLNSCDQITPSDDFKDSKDFESGNECIENEDIDLEDPLIEQEENIKNFKNMAIECDNNIQDNLDKGNIIGHSRSTKTVRKHRCSECGALFKKIEHLNVHRAYKHEEKQFKCDLCNKKFARKYDLAYHHRVHTGEKPFTCEFCGKSFASSSYLHTHTRLHTGQKKLKCDTCQNSFVSSDQLQIHIRQKHTGERPFLCELCSHGFTSSSALFRHKRDVHHEKVECPVCCKLFSERVLKEHIKRHKEKEQGIKRFSCDVCNKRFTCETSRKRHFIIHTGEKAFKCELCEKSFNQRSTLQTHRKIHSLIMPFQCDNCNKSFRHKHHLKLHLKKHHTMDELNNKPFYEIKTE